LLLAMRKRVFQHLKLARGTVMDCGCGGLNGFKASADFAKAGYGAFDLRVEGR
jgi:hypothetical protein